MPSTPLGSDAEISSRRIETSRIGLRVREAGHGAPIILLHGITANAAVWDPVMQELAADHHCIALDQRGHGGSDRPEADSSAYSAAAYAEDILALVRELGEGPAILVGHSLGARNSVVAGWSAPELVRAVVAIDFTPRIEDAVFDSLSARVAGGDRTFDSAADIEVYLRERYPLMPSDAVKRRVEHGYRPTDGGLRALADPAALAATAEGLRESFEDAFLGIGVPTVLVRGADSHLVSPSAWAASKQLRSDLKAIEVEHTDHYVPEEDPIAIATIVRRVSESHSGSPDAAPGGESVTSGARA